MAQWVQAPTQQGVSQRGGGMDGWPGQDGKGGNFSQREKKMHKPERTLRRGVMGAMISGQRPRCGLVC